MPPLKRGIFIVVIASASVALAVPLVGLRASASSTTGTSTAVATARAAAGATGGAAVQQQLEQQREASGETSVEQGSSGKISADTLRALGIKKVANPAEASAKIGQKLTGTKKSGGGEVSIQ